MGVCVQIQSDGTLLQNAQTIQDCAGHWLASPQESMWSVVFAQWLVIPDLATQILWFTGPCSVIVACYLIAYFSAMPVSIFKRD